MVLLNKLIIKINHCMWKKTDEYSKLLIKSLFQDILIVEYFNSSVQGHEGAVLALAFTPDASYLLTTCTLGTLKLWSVLALSSGEDCCLTTYDDACDLGVTTCDFSNVQSTTSGKLELKFKKLRNYKIFFLNVKN